MKKAFLSLLLLSSLAAGAQVSDGYYRVLNKSSERYISVTHDKASISYSDKSADLSALLTMKGFETVETDPGSVIRLINSNGGYILESQGINTYQMIGHYMKLRESGDAYMAYASQSGFTLYLWDEDFIDTQTWTVVVDSGYVSTKQNKNDNNRRLWYIKEVNQDAGQYFGVAPKLAVNGRYYQTFIAGFPFSFVGSDRKAYVVDFVDETLGIAVWSEVSGPVAAGTPVILSCPSSVAADNKLNVGASGAATVSSNLLVGVYFNRYNPKMNIENRVANNPQTMRFLGTTSEGKLGFVTSTEGYVPRNTAYLPVSSSAPAELRLMTRSEYEEEKNNDEVTIAATNCSREYGEPNPTFQYTVNGTIKGGTPVLSTTATQQSAVGTYPITVSRGTVTNNVVNTVNGTLTITCAPLTIAARSYTIKQNEPLPAFAADYSGFKLGETSSVLTAQPVFTTNAPADKTPGTYQITVSGAAADNYSISYTGGTLTILQADPITITAASATMTYGDNMPQLGYSATSDAFTGQPVVTCEATSASPVGTYAIKIEKGTIDYPNLILVDGVLTITKAMLTVRPKDVTRLQGEPNPEFELGYTGFRNGDNESSLTVVPVASTTATEDSPAGRYPILVSGGEAHDYSFRYVPGVLTVIAKSGIKAVEFATPVDVYTVTGRKVCTQVTTLEGLPHGVYIVNGRKMVY